MLVAATCLFAAAVAAAQDPKAGSAFEIFALQPFVRTEARPVPPYGSLLVRDPADHVDLLAGGDDETSFAPDQAAEWLRGLHAEAFEREGVHWWTNETSLMFWADGELLQQVRADLRQLMDLLGRPIDLEVAVYVDDGAEQPPTVVTPAQLAAMLGNRQPLWRSGARTRTNVPVVLDQGRWSRYVRDVDVEVAQKSDLATPVVNVFYEGASVAVAAHALTDAEDLVLCVQFALGQRRKIDTFTSGVRAHPAIDLPLLETAFGGASARVPAGGAMLLPLAGDPATGCRLLLVTSPRYPTPRPGERPSGTAVLPISALTTHALRARQPLPSLRPRLGDEHSEQMEETAYGAEGALEIDQLLDIVRTAIGDDGVDVSSGGGFLFLRGSADAQATAAATLRALQDRLLRTIEVRCRVDGRPVDGSGPFAAPTAGAAVRRLHEVALPCLPGRASVLFRGLETSFVRTQLPEIAQEAQALDPQVETLQSGLWLRCSPSISMQGISPDLDIQFGRHADATLRSLAPGGMLMLTDSETMHLRRTAAWADGAEESLGQGPVVVLDGHGLRTEVTVRIGAPGRTPDGGRER